MEFTGYVEDYRLRDLLRIGQAATILKGSSTTAWNPMVFAEGLMIEADLQVVVTNFLPGHTDIYADSMGKRKTHNHQVVWKNGDTWYSTDINNVKEIRDA